MSFTIDVLIKLVTPVFSSSPLAGSYVASCKYKGVYNTAYQLSKFRCLGYLKICQNIMSAALKGLLELVYHQSMGAWPDW